MTRTMEDKLRAATRRKVLADSRYAIRRSTVKMTQYTPEVLAARATFVERWNALNIEGLAAGHIRWTNDYEGSHLEAVDETAYEDGRKWLETIEEHAQRINDEVELRFAHAMREFLSKLA